MGLYDIDNMTLVCFLVFVLKKEERVHLFATTFSVLKN